MADYLFISSWANGASSLKSSPPAQLTRSTTPSPVQPSKSRNALPLPYRLVKSKSFAQLRKGGVDGGEEGMAATAVSSPVSALRDEGVMDTRTPSPVAGKESEEVGREGSVDGSYQPDLSQEVAMLSTKLVNAINYQTNLDDSLQATRHELEISQQELARVRAEKQSLDDAVTQGVLVKKSEVDKVIAELRVELAKEKASRETAEKAKRQTDGELENLTASLFEEANNMVAAARQDTDAVEKRNSQLRNQIKDAQVLLASQQEQLQDLKLNMERQSKRTDFRDTSLPSTPINSASAVFDATYDSPSTTAQPADVPPAHPLSFTHLVQPVLRNDVAAYTDFAELLNWARWARQQSTLPHSRNASSTSQTNLSTAASTSSPNLPGSFFTTATPSASNSPTSTAATFTPPLKESKFYKRSLTEDIEPTLRLDLAPGLSFLSRRTVLSSLLAGTLTIEPFLPPTKFYSPIFACSLCGEARKAPPYLRQHRFRTSESEDAARYPLCGYCLERVRASADFVGFLRMVRDGHWRCGSEEEDRGAWGEGVRLRERMFWARVGGGVVPAASASGGGGGRRGTEVESPTKAKVGKSRSSESDAEAVKTGLERGGEDSTAPPPSSSHSTDDADADAGLVGIGRAIINMASRATSSAMPELHRDSDASLTIRNLDDTPHTPPAVSTAVGDEAASASAAPQALAEVEGETERQQEDISESQQDQADANAQLQREASTTSERESELEDAAMATPPETPFHDLPSSDHAGAGVGVAAPAVPVERDGVVEEVEAAPTAVQAAAEPTAPLAAEEEEVEEEQRARTPSPRTRSSNTEPSTETATPQPQPELSQSPQRSQSPLPSQPLGPQLAPRPTQEERERRPSSSASVSSTKSSVLARVRAMEGKGR